MFAKVLGKWLARSVDLQLAGIAKSGHEGWELCLATRPEIVLLDVEMGDGDGLELARRLRAELPDVRVIIMTGRVNPHTAWQANEAGVSGLINKTLELDQLGQVIRLVAAGGRFVCPHFQRIRDEWLAQPEAFHKVLSNREVAVLCRVTEGQNDAVIAQALEISDSTVAGHRKSIRNKLNLHDDLGLVAYGRTWGICTPSHGRA